MQCLCWRDSGGVLFIYSLSFLCVSLFVSLFLCLSLFQFLHVDVQIIQEQSEFEFLHLLIITLEIFTSCFTFFERIPNMPYQTHFCPDHIGIFVSALML